MTYVVERADQAIRTLGTKEYRRFAFVFAGQMESSDTLSAVSGVDGNSNALGMSEPTSVVQFGTPAINGAAITVDGEPVRASAAVQCLLRAPNGEAGTIYTVTCRATTTGGETLEVIGYFRVE